MGQLYHIVSSFDADCNVSVKKLLVNISAPHNLTQPISFRTHLEHKLTHYLFANFELEFLFCFLILPSAVIYFCGV